eukprot:2803002-Amphidinium_carterae.1
MLQHCSSTDVDALIKGTRCLYPSSATTWLDVEVGSMTGPGTIFRVGAVLRLKSLAQKQCGVESVAAVLRVKSLAQVCIDEAFQICATEGRMISSDCIKPNLWIACMSMACAMRVPNLVLLCSCLDTVCVCTQNNCSIGTCRHVHMYKDYTLFCYMTQGE